MKNFHLQFVFWFILSVAIPVTFHAYTSGPEISTEIAEVTAANGADLKSASANVAADVKMEFEQTQPPGVFSIGFLANNWGILTLSLIAFLEVVVRLTPSEKDNSILSLISKIVSAFIPNNRSSGGVF